MSAKFNQIEYLVLLSVLSLASHKVIVEGEQFLCQNSETRPFTGKAVIFLPDFFSFTRSVSKKVVFKPNLFNGKH